MSVSRSNWRKTNLKQKHDVYPAGATFNIVKISVTRKSLAFILIYLINLVFYIFGLAYHDGAHYILLFSLFNKQYKKYNISSFFHTALSPEH